jgi:hypothetical protein
MTRYVENVLFWIIKKINSLNISVFRICIGFSVDPVSDPGSQTNADPDLDPGQTLISQKG